MSSRDKKRISHSQNFLRKSSVARRLVQTTSIARQDTVLEIGSGNGILTCEIARHAGEVIAVEADAALAEATRKRTHSFRNIQVHCADFFDFRLPDTPFRVFANIPYNATSAIIERLTGDVPLVDSHLVVQREAAERYTGLRKTTLTSVLLYPWFEVDIRARLRRSDFAPRPRVDSVLLRIGRREEPLVGSGYASAFRDFVTFGFTAWQPDVRTAFSHVFTGGVRREIELAAIDLKRRPSELSREEWLRLFRIFIGKAPPAKRKRIGGAYRRLRSEQANLKKSHRTRSGS